MNTRFRWLWPLLLACPMAAQADALYKCIQEGGQVLYTNQKAPDKKCTVLSQDKSVSSYSPPKSAPKAPATATPADFPKVSSDTQRSRDTDRRRILEKELATESENLTGARKKLTEQESQVLPQERNVAGGLNMAKVLERLQPFREAVQLHERNVEALNKEIGNLK